MQGISNINKQREKRALERGTPAAQLALLASSSRRRRVVGVDGPRRKPARVAIRPPVGPGYTVPVVQHEDQCKPSRWMRAGAVTLLALVVSYLALAAWSFALGGW